MSDAGQPGGQAVAHAPEPLKGRFVSELVEDERVTSSFLVKHKETRAKKGSGEPYLSLILGDRTGDLDAKMWDNVEEVAGTFERDDFVKVRGAVLVYKNRPQLQIHRLRKIDESEIDIADFLPTTRFDIEAMFADLMERVAAVRDSHLRALLTAIFSDEEIARRFKRAPAAKSLHHAFFGGLLEHVRSLSRLAALVVQNYAGVDADLLFAGVMLHDLGKIHELAYERSFSYTTEGQLLGHMILVLEVIHEKIRAIDGFPRALQTALEHLVISHHGKYEFGSPKLPMFPEALLLHYIDDLDSKMQAMESLLAREGAQAGDWTSFSPSLDRTLLKLDRWLSPPAEAGTTAPVEPARKPDSDPARGAQATRDAEPPGSVRNLFEAAERLQDRLRGGQL